MDWEAHVPAFDIFWWARHGQAKRHILHTHIFSAQILPREGPSWQDRCLGSVHGKHNCKGTILWTANPSPLVSAAGTKSKSKLHVCVCVLPTSVFLGCAHWWAYTKTVQCFPSRRGSFHDMDDVMNIWETLGNNLVKSRKATRILW